MEEITIYRDTKLIQIRDMNPWLIQVCDLDYRENYDFIEIFIELEKINDISFVYAPYMEENILEEKLVYNRDKTIEQILK